MINFLLNVIYKINIKCGERVGFVKVYNYERVENIFWC